MLTYEYSFNLGLNCGRPFARHSSPRASPTRRARSMSNDEPRPVDDGKQLEGIPLKTEESVSRHIGSAAMQLTSGASYAIWT